MNSKMKTNALVQATLVLLFLLVTPGICPLQAGIPLQVGTLLPVHPGNPSGTSLQPGDASYDSSLPGSGEAGVSARQANETIRGKVTDSSGSPLPGVTVVLKGTSRGTITDSEGKYVIEAGPGAELSFSYIGYASQSVTVDGTEINIVMQEDLMNLEEVVVVGYGSQQKKDITGSVAIVDNEALLASTGSSATQQLQGKAAGVYIGQSGSPGSATMVRIRGINTVNDNGPLYVIDGVSTRNQDLGTLNPNDIESIQILKDASSAAIYGAQAANGVILITTKKGNKTGQPVLTYDSYIGFQKTGRSYDVLNSTDRLNLEWQAKANNYSINGISGYPSHVQFGTGPEPVIPNYMTQAGANGSQTIDPDTYSYPDNTMVEFSNTDWWKEIDRVALIQNHQLGLSGGTDKGQYNLSLNLFDQDGTLIHSNYKRYSIRANSSYNLRSWLRMGENLTYAWTKDINLNPNGAESTAYSWTYRASPYVPVYDIQGNYAGSKIAGTGNWQNPVANLTRSKDNYWSHTRVFGNVWAEADLYKGLTAKTTFGIDYTNNYSYAMTKNNPEFSETTGQNYLEEISGFNFRWVWTNTITYQAIFNDVHNLNALAGIEAIRDGLGRSLTGRRYNYLFEDDENTWTLDMGENDSQRLANSSYNGEFALFGIFGRVDYSFQNKYLLTGIVRRDGTSRFSSNNRYGTFPSVSVGWRLSEESFLAGTRNWLDDLKLRFGYGKTGNSEIPRATNFADEFTTNPKRTNYDLTGSNTLAEMGYKLNQYGNKDTKWESTDMYNVGLDATLLKGLFSLTAEWYSKKTSDMLVQASYSALAGDATKPYIDFGDIKNTGWEFNLNYRDNLKDLKWEMNLNLSHYKNEVVRIAESDDASLWGSGARLSTAITRTTKGHAISEFYGYIVDGFYETAQEVLDVKPLGSDVSTLEDAEAWVGKFKFKDVVPDGELTTSDRTFIGSPHPDLIAGLNLSLTWRNWDMTMFWYSTIGNELFNNTKYFTDFWLFEGNRSSRMRDQSWVAGADNRNATLPVLDYGDTYSGTNPNSYYVENASFLKLKNLLIGYTLPESIFGKSTISRLRFYLQAENLFTITGYDGLDPEFTNTNINGGSGSDLLKGVDTGGWPNTKRFLVGVNFTF